MANKIFNDFQGNTVKIDGVCYTFIGETTSGVNATPSEVGGVFPSCLECALESSSSSSSSSSELYSESSSSSSFDPLSESSSSSSSSEMYSESSSSSGGGGAELSKVNCGSSPQDTYPRLKVTVCGGSGYPKTLFGESWTDGESKILCPDGYSTSGTGPGFTFVERWLFDNTVIANDTNPKIGLVVNVTSFKSYHGHIEISEGGSFSFRPYENEGTMGSTGTILTGAATGATFAPSGSALNPDSIGLKDHWFGHITMTNGTTIKWSPISGSGQSWGSWLNTGLAYTNTTANEACP
jgi:hypothetical protein